MNPSKSRCVLVVDDEASLRLMIVRFLAQAGWEGATAGNRKEALDLLEKGEFTHAIIDVHLGCESGYEVIQEVRGRRPGLWILAMTGARTGASQAALRAGADSFLEKPVSRLSEIVKALEGADIHVE